MFHSNFDFEEMERLALRISSSFFYLFAAYFTALVTTDFVVDVAPSRDILYILFKLCLVMMIWHIGIVLVLGGAVNRRSFAQIAAAWSAPLLVFLLWGTV